jgi:hypothetical protein
MDPAPDPDLLISDLQDSNNVQIWILNTEFKCGNTILEELLNLTDFLEMSTILAVGYMPMAASV